MSREQKSKRRKKLGRKKQRRYRRFWQRVTSNKYDRILEIARCFTRNITDAQDLAQTVVFRLLKYCPKPIRIINLDSYIFISTRHAWLDSQPSHKEIKFSELRKTDAPQISVLDPNLERFLETCDIKALVGKAVSNDTQLMRTKILLEAGYKLPEIAKLLGEPVRRTRHRWYRNRDAQQKALRAMTKKNLVSSRLN